MSVARGQTLLVKVKPNRESRSTVSEPVPTMAFCANTTFSTKYANASVASAR